MKILFGINEKKLVQLCRKGDTKSQYRLYKLYFKSMYNTAVRITGDKDISEDVLQEAFIKAFKELEMLRDDRAFGGWLKRIVINKSIDETKKRKYVLQATESISEQHSEISEEIDDNTDPALVHHLIKKLPDGAREILVLRALEGYKHTEIAKKLNISESTSKTQFHRAKLLLAKMIKESDDEFEHREIFKEKQVEA